MAHVVDLVSFDNCAVTPTHGERLNFFGEIRNWLSIHNESAVHETIADDGARAPGLSMVREFTAMSGVQNNRRASRDKAVVGLNGDASIDDAVEDLDGGRCGIARKHCEYVTRFPCGLSTPVDGFNPPDSRMAPLNSNRSSRDRIRLVGEIAIDCQIRDLEEVGLCRVISKHVAHRKALRPFGCGGNQFQGRHVDSGTNDP
jgi:hypothetical protein